MIFGVSWRMVLDDGNWNATFTLTAWANPATRTARITGDLFPLWARDESVPLLFTREAVDAAAEARILLRAAPTA